LNLGPRVSVLLPTIAESRDLQERASLGELNGGTELDLDRLWLAVRKHALLLACIALTVGTMVGVRDLLETPLYTAHAKILIQTNAPQLFQNASSSNGVDESAEPAADLATEYELLKSRTLAVAVVKSEDLAHDAAFTSSAGVRAWLQRLTGSFESRSDKGRTNPAAASPQLINRYQSSLIVTPVENTRLVDVSFTSPNAELSAKVANAHVRQYILQGIQLNSAASDEAAQFLQGKLAVLKTQLEDSEAALNVYQRNKGIVPGLLSLDGKDDVVLNRLDRLNDQVEEAHLKAVGLETSVDLINQGHATELPAIANDPEIQELEQKLSDREVRHASLAGEFKPDYPEMARANAELETTRSELKQAIDGIIARTKVEYLQVSRDEQSLDQELAEQKAFALGLNDAAVKYNILAREAETNRELYQAVLKRMKDVEVTQDLHTSRVSIVDPAIPPLAPSSPRTFRDLTAGLLVGLLGGIGAVLFLEQMDQSLKNAEDVELYLQVPTLGVIPNFHRRASGGYTTLGSRQPELPELPSEYAHAIAVSHGTGSPTGEAYRILRTALLLSRAGAPPQTVLVTSALAGEGKTATASNLAIALARTRKKVLLIDADLRRPACHKMLAIANHLGLTEVLTGMRTLDGLIHDTAIEDLKLLSSGEIPPNPSELLGSVEMVEVLSKLKERFDCVVIDSPPIIPVTDAMLLAGKVDGVIVVAARQTERQQVKLAVSRLSRINAHVFGVVLNKTEWIDGPYHYQYYFGSPNSN
jgi:polysaccharide biosynthesis transport protein